MPHYKPKNGRTLELAEDTKLAAMALAQMWPLDVEQRANLIANQMLILNDYSIPPVVRTMAAANIIKAGAHNLKVMEVLLQASAQQPQVPVTNPVDVQEVARGLQSLLASVDHGVDEVTESTGSESREIAAVDGWKLHATG